MFTFFKSKTIFNYDICNVLEWQPAFKLQILIFIQYAISFELFFNSAQGALLLTFSQNAQGAPISFRFNYLLYRHIRMILLKKVQLLFALFNSMKGPGHCLPPCFTFLYFNIFKLNASGSSTTYVRF